MQTLSEDIFLEFFHAFEVRDLLRCRAVRRSSSFSDLSHPHLDDQVCRRFLHMIDGTQTLLYKIELAAADMVDSEPSPYRSVNERLSSLRVHQAAFISSEMRFHPTVSRPGQPTLGAVWPVSGGVIPYSDGWSLRLFRPSSASRNIPARHWSFDTLPAPVEHISGCKVDLSEGLLALLIPDWNEE